MHRKTMLQRRRTMAKQTILVATFLIQSVVGSTGDCYTTNNIALDEDIFFQEPCTSFRCKRAAKNMDLQMNWQINPCQNFREFACGGETVVRPNVERVTRNNLEDRRWGKNENFKRKMKQVYGACMGNDVTESLVLAQYTTSPLMKMWPSVNRDWDSSQFNLLDSLITYASDSVQPFFDVSVDMTKKPHKKLNFIWVEFLKASPPHFPIPIEYFLLETSHTTVTSAIEKLRSQYIEMTSLFGTDSSVAKQDADDYIDLLRKVAKAVPTTTEVFRSEDDYFLRYKVHENVKWVDMTLNRMKEYFTALDLDLSEVVRVTGVKKGLSVSGNLNVRIANNFLVPLVGILRSADIRTIQNVLGFQYARMRLPKPSRYAVERFNDSMLGFVSGTCLEITKEIFRDGVTNAFLADEEISSDLKTMMSDMARELTWHFELNRDHTTHPLTKFDVSFSFIRQILITTLMISSLQENYEQMSNESLQENYEQIQHTPLRMASLQQNNEQMRHSFLRLSNQVTDTGPVSSIYRIAIYPNFECGLFKLNSDEKNSTLILEQILYKFDVPRRFLAYARRCMIHLTIQRSPVAIFPSGYPRSLNCAFLGAYLARYNLLMPIIHETNSSRLGIDKECLKKRGTCFRDQYALYARNQPSHNFTLSNKADAINMAITEGLHMAYRAFRNFRGINRVPLPGVNLTIDQQLFVAFAQNHCQKTEALRGTFHEPPNEYRINSAVQNNVDFANVFDCPEGAPMNPKDKCGVR